MFGYHGDLDEEVIDLMESAFDYGPSARAAVAEHLKTVTANGGESAETETLVQEARHLAEQAESFADQLEEISQSE